MLAFQVLQNLHVASRFDFSQRDHLTGERVVARAGKVEVKVVVGKVVEKDVAVARVAHQRT